MLAATLAAAAVIGLLLGLLGGGGSILTVPVLAYVANQAAGSAIPESLFVVAVTSAVALLAHARARRVEWRTGLLFGVAGLAGAYAGGRLATHLPATVLLTGFALLMVIAALIMIRSCGHSSPYVPRTRPPIALVGLGIVVGGITGLVGAGGGFVIVPVLALLAGLTMSTAVGTSLLVITLQASAGLAGHLPHAAIDWALTLTVTAVAILGSLAGARLAGRVPAPLLRAAFGWFLLAMSAFVLLQQAPGGIWDALATTIGGLVALGIGGAALTSIAVRHVWSCRNRAARRHVKAVTSTA